MQSCVQIVPCSGLQFPPLIGLPVWQSCVRPIAKASPVPQTANVRGVTARGRTSLRSVLNCMAMRVVLAI